MIERFRYHAFTTGVSGHITHPFDEILPIQASIALPESGGFGTARAERFDFHGIFSFESAQAAVAGNFSPKDRSFDAVATVTINGLNILNMVTADRVVARIASSHPEDPALGHSITPLGSYFENLRIAGFRVDLDLATCTFDRLDNATKLRAAYRDNQEGFRDEFDRLTLTGRNDVPAGLRKYFPCLGPQAPRIEESRGVIACSLVREVAGLPKELRPVGHVIRVPGFGIVRLAEFIITDNERSITMLQVDLGSTPSGSGSIGGAAGNGSDY
ncbi:MAG TPA: hypothetical protein VMT86_11100 [Bryobacteraceae bacterium]|nr:hypothetical protein [Bryobacteraceae bacterium]